MVLTSFLFLPDTCAIEKPYMLTLEKNIEGSSITIYWSKILHIPEITYILSYYKNNEIEKTIQQNIGDPSISDDIAQQETLSYTITNLEGGNEYCLKLKAMTKDDESPWCDAQCVFLNIYPVFDTLLTFPADGDTDIKKTPELRWLAIDAEGEKLEYYFTFGENRNRLNLTRSFSELTSYQISTMLKPNATYYWQVWVREQGQQYIDYYNSDYPKSDIWHFTTIHSGHDLAITEVSFTDTIRPDSEIVFQLQVKNFGNETSPPQIIKSKYIKNDSESLFYIGENATGQTVEPGETILMNIKVKFQYELINNNGQLYDNILIPGESKINFFFTPVHDQDLELSNNEYIVTIHYNDINAPQLTNFHLNAYGDWPDSWWALQGNPLSVSFQAEDDILISEIMLQYRLFLTNQWETIRQQTISQQKTDFFYQWKIPENIVLTNNAQIQILLYDGQNNETVIQSDPFAIHSNAISATIAIPNNEYMVNEQLSYTITTQMDNPIKNYTVRLIYGSETTIIQYHECEIQQGRWTINDNQYVNKNCYLEMTLYDIYANEIIVTSEPFIIRPYVPFPFSIIELFDDEHNFPIDAANMIEKKSIKHIKIDNNIIHAIVLHHCEYTQNDIYKCFNDQFYISYNLTTQKRLSKIKICDNDRDTVDFEIFSETPHILLKNALEQYYWTFQKDHQFMPEISVLNRNIPQITGIEHLHECSMIEDLSSDRYINARGYVSNQQGSWHYLWKLSIHHSTINRVKYYKGECYPLEVVDVNNETGKNLESRWVLPVADEYLIYFIDPYQSMLVNFNTQIRSLRVKGYDLPFEIGNNSQMAFQTAIAASSDEVFVFGNGKVYQLIDEQLVEKSDISYTFNTSEVSYATDWNNNIRKAITCVAQDQIYLMLELNNDSYPQPKSSNLEILQFEPETFTFSKQIVEASQFFPITEFTHLKNTNRIIFSRKQHYENHCQFESFHYLFDLTTGAYNCIGASNVVAPFFVYDFELYRLYALSAQTSDSYKITLSSKQSNTVQINNIQFIRKDNSMNLVWQHGKPYDGTWNDEYHQTNDALNQSMFLMPLFPQKQEAYEISNDTIDFDSSMKKEVSFENDMLRIEKNKNTDSYIVSQVDLRSGYTNKTFVGIADNCCHTIDVSNNRFVIIAWDNYCALADYSTMFLDIDMNNDRNINLYDAILALERCAGLKTINVNKRDCLNTAMLLLQLLMK